MGFTDRQSFRMKYPKEVRPKAESKNEIFEVIDLSETGAKFKAKGQFKPKIGTALVGKMIFFDQNTCDLDGKIVRIVGDLIMIKFENGFPRDILAREADMLIERFGKISSDRY